MLHTRSMSWSAKVWSGAACALFLSTPLLQAQMMGGPAKPAAVPDFVPAAVGPNVKMNGPQEPMPEGRLGRPPEAIAADPTGKLLVAAWETTQGTCGGSFGGACKQNNPPGVTAVGYSTDGGKTWTDLGAPYLGGDAMTSGRPWLDRGGKDNQMYFLTSRAADVAAKQLAPGEMATPGGTNQAGLMLYRGRFKDGVFTWTDQRLFPPWKPKDLLRSPSVMAAKDGSGRVWIAFSTLLGICGRTGGSGGGISVMRSLDEGKTWEQPVVISPDEFTEWGELRRENTSCGSKGAIQILPSLALGSKNELYATWEHGPDLLSLEPLALGNTTKIGFARSLDGGKTFDPPQVLTVVNSLREDSPVGYSKPTMNDIPRIAVATGGAHKGRVYVTYTSAVEKAPVPAPWDQLLVSSQVFLVYSDDQGKTWSQPVPLAADVPPKGIKRFWPTLAVRQDGTVDVVYMESLERQTTRDPGDTECSIMMVMDATRAGRYVSLIDVYWVQSTDGGASFGPPVRVSSETTNWCKVKYDYQTTQYANFGDVLGVFTTGVRTFVVWPDGRNGVPDAYFAELVDYKAGAAAAAKPAEAAKTSQ